MPVDAMRRSRQIDFPESRPLTGADRDKQGWTREALINGTYTLRVALQE